MLFNSFRHQMKGKYKIIIMITIILTIMLGLFNLFGPKEGQLDTYHSNKLQNTDKTIYGFTMDDIDGKPVSLSDFKGKVVLIVNVASKCGLTSQYKELQALYEQYSSKGLVILAFPANNFLGQEPGTDQEIKAFCSKNYGVTFPVFSKISVKGKDMSPLYTFLTSKEENGVMDSSVKWNFQKYLIDREGRLVTFFDPRTSVTDEKVKEAIIQLF
jgi:glutathione peroxidase